MTNLRSSEDKLCEVKPSTDLDEACKIVCRWSQMIQNENQENEKLRYQIKSLEWKMLLLETSHADCKKQKEDLLSTISKLQKSFESKLDQTEEIAKLQLKVKQMTESNKVNKKACEVEIEKEKEALENLRKHYEDCICEIRVIHNSSVSELVDKHDETVTEFQSKIHEIEERRKNDDKKHESELVKCHIEYENRLSAVNGELNRLRTNTGGQQKKSVASEVLQRKLKHQEERHLQEVTSLKNELQQLKGELEQQRGVNRFTSTPHPLPSNIKRRKF